LARFLPFPTAIFEQKNVATVSKLVDMTLFREGKLDLAVLPGENSNGSTASYDLIRRDSDSRHGPRNGFEQKTIALVG
jgi:hypothetical protein